MSTVLSKRKRVSTPKLSKRHKPINTQSDIVQIQPSESHRSNSDLSMWISASKTRNYLLKDPIIDWLKYKRPQSTSNNDFCSFIMRQGLKFEEHVVNILRKKFGTKFCDIGGNEENCRTLDTYKKTISAMKKGHPIIYSGVVRHYPTETFGIPDLLIRSDWLNRLVDTIVYPKSKDSAPELQGRKKSAPNYHYVVVDIKYATLHLRSNGTQLLNCGSLPAYKGQIYLYNLALADMQGYNPHTAFLLGRGWKYNVGADTYRGYNCFSKLGMIDYLGFDNGYPEQTMKAVQWLKDLNLNGDKWSVDKVPFPRAELYPNMCNKDNNWYSAKKEIADRVNEITQIWKCGPKHRESAHSKGIIKWSDKRCTVDALGIAGDYTRNIITKILHINRTKRGASVLPKHVKLNLNRWKLTRPIEFYVDFETITNVIGDIFTSSDDRVYIPDCNMICVIGVHAVMHSDEGSETLFRTFAVNSLTHEEEWRVCREFKEYVYDMCIEQECDDPLICHWGMAEAIAWENTISRNLDEDNESELKEWDALCEKFFDMLHLFREEPITIRGCKGFGLKEVVSNLVKLKKIRSDWSNEDCQNGCDAMLSIRRAHGEYPENMMRSHYMKDVIKYNKVDCVVLHEILSYLRENHV